MTDVEIRKPVALRTIPGVELAAVGTWHSSTGWVTFTAEDFTHAVAALECPGVRNPVIKLGHEEEDSTSGIRWDGEPAVGWIGNMQFDGAKVYGDYTGVPAWLADPDDAGLSVIASAYPDRSIEISRPFLCQVGHLHPAVITALSLLGVAQPGIGVLKSMQDVYAMFTEPLSGDVERVAADQLSRATIATTVRLAAGETREPTALETKAGIDHDALQETWQTVLDDLVGEWDGVTEAQLDELAAQITDAVDDDPGLLGKLAVGSAAGATLLLAAMDDVAGKAMDSVISEAKSQGVAVDKPDAPDLEELATAIAAAMAASTASTAGRTAAQDLRPGEGAAVAAGVRAHMESLTDRFLRDQLGGALSAAQARGRFTVLEVAPIGEWYASERIDSNTCAPCRSIDQTRFDTLAEAKAVYGNGKYVSCLGGLRCRGQVFATWGSALSAAPWCECGLSITVPAGSPLHKPHCTRAAVAHLSTTGGAMAPGARAAVVQASVSTEDISRSYYESAGYSMWITAMHVDPLELIAADDATGKFFRIPVELSGEEFSFGEPVEVAINYVPVASKAAAAFPHRWGTREAALAAAGVKSGAEPSAAPADPPIAPEVSPAGAAIRKMATATADPATTTQTPAAEPGTGETEKEKEASVDAAKMREALGLPADATLEQVTEAFTAQLAADASTATPGTDAAPSADTVDALSALAGTGQAVLVDRAQLTELVQMAKRGDAAFIENRRNERDHFLEAACREGRFPSASLAAYKKLWDLDPEGTRKQVSLLAKNIIPVTAGGLLGDGEDPAAANEADLAYQGMYGKGK